MGRRRETVRNVHNVEANAVHRGRCPALSFPLETDRLAGGLTITDQSIGVAALTKGFIGVDGILG